MPFKDRTYIHQYGKIEFQQFNSIDLQNETATFIDIFINELYAKINSLGNVLC